jgi:glycosyltransferase involved in cell wall biosynthesis
VAESTGPFSRVTVIIPARNEAGRIASVIGAVKEQQPHAIELEVLVADDGSTDGTAARATAAGARVVQQPGSPGNPGAARNRAVSQARGDVLVFLDADCMPVSGWFSAHLAAQNVGHAIVGGSLALAPGLPWSARADYYVSSYHVHPGRSPGPVPNHPPANLSVRRDVFQATSGFAESFAVADGHEELGWQREAASRNIPVYFDPHAMVLHWNRPGLGNLLGRSYRWGYSALEAKSASRVSRGAWLYRLPLLAMLAAYPVSLLEVGYITALWIAAGRWSFLQFLPVLVLARLVYATAFIVGGSRWLLKRTGQPGMRPQWR